MAGEAFSDAAGVKLVHVPYKGEGPAYSDLMAGVVEVAVANINAITPLLRATVCARWPSRAGALAAAAGCAHRGRGGRARLRIYRLVRADDAGGHAQPIVDRLLADLKTAVEQPGMKRYFEEQGMSAR